MNTSPLTVRSNDPRFLLALFFVPLVLCVGGSAWILFFSNELFTTRSGLKHQLKGEGIYGRSIISDEFHYKQLLYQTVRPTVMTLGSSRTNCFRGLYFREPMRFITASRAMNSLPMGLSFADFILAEEHRPQWVLIGLDFWWFHPSSNKVDSNYAPRTGTDSFFYILRSGLPHLRELWPRMIFDPAILGRHRGAPAVGSRAMQYGEGFLPDGSYVRENQPRATGDRPFIKLIEEIDRGPGRWAYGDVVSPLAMERLGQLVDRLRQGGVGVVVFMPALAPDVCDHLEQSPRHAYFMKVRTEAAALCAGKGLPFYDFSKMDEPRDACYRDGFHAGEYLSSVMMSRMPEMADYLDWSKLGAIWKRPVQVHYTAGEVEAWCRTGGDF